MQDLAPSARAAIVAGCAKFLQDARPEDLRDMRPDQIGHDIWLTSQGHGAGFWDRGLGEAGERLTLVAHACGLKDIYIGDDGLIYMEG